MRCTIPFNEIKKYLADLVRAEERLNYKPGQILFYEGHKTYGIYVLRKGRIRLFHKKEDRDEILKIVEPNQILGENEFISGRPFSYSAKAETETAVSFFSRTSMEPNEGNHYEIKNESSYEI